MPALPALESLKKDVEPPGALTMNALPAVDRLKKFVPP
jgi:hypothetical protein